MRSSKVILSAIIIISIFQACSTVDNDSNTSGKTFSLISDPADLTITILFDNYIFDERLTDEWGFSALIEYGNETILFDTGLDGTILLNNMNLMGVDPQSIDKIIISHDHGDHTGGLETLLQLGITPDVYMHGTFSPAIQEMASSYTNLIIVNDPMEITHGIYSTGPIPVSVDEQGLIITSKQGFVIITGCAHPGADRMVNKTNQLIDGNIHLVMGGFHMGTANDLQVQNLIDHFIEHEVANVMCTHCSGLPCINAFSTAYGDNYLPGGVGKVITITD